MVLKLGVLKHLSVKNESFHSTVHFISCNVPHIVMLNVAEQPELPVGPLRMDEGLKRSMELLDSHPLFGLLVDGGAKKDKTHALIDRVHTGSHDSHRCNDARQQPLLLF